MTSSASFLLYLVRLGIHPEAELVSTPADVDWEAVSNLASEQKVTAIAWDGYARLYEAGMVTVDMDRSIKKVWLASVYEMYVLRYPVYRATIGHLASVYARHGFRMMVLKGYGLSLNYPVPEHRESRSVGPTIITRPSISRTSFSRIIMISSMSMRIPPARSWRRA